MFSQRRDEEGDHYSLRQTSVVIRMESELKDGFLDFWASDPEVRRMRSLRNLNHFTWRHGGRQTVRQHILSPYTWPFLLLPPSSYVRSKNVRPFKQTRVTEPTDPNIQASNRFHGFLRTHSS